MRRSSSLAVCALLLAIATPYGFAQDGVWTCTVRNKIRLLAVSKAGVGSPGRPGGHQARPTELDVPLTFSTGRFALGDEADSPVLTGNLGAGRNDRTFVLMSGGDELAEWIAAQIGVETVSGTLLGTAKVNGRSGRLKARLLITFVGELPTDLVFGSMQIDVRGELAQVGG